MNKAKDLYKKIRIPLWTVIGIAGVFFVWWLISYILKTSLFPGPQRVIPEMFRLLGEGRTWAAIGGTLLRLIISIAIGMAFGLLLGVIAGLNSAFKAFLRPFITIFRTIPTAAVIYILIVLVAPNVAPVIIVFLMTFPILYESILSGMTSIDPNVVEAAQIDGAGLFKKIFKIYLPLSSNYILLGLVSSIGLGMKVAIMSEILAGGESALGLGKLIQNAAITIEMKPILAYSLIAIVIIGMVDVAVYFVKKKIKADSGIKK